MNVLGNAALASFAGRTVCVLAASGLALSVSGCAMLDGLLVDGSGESGPSVTTTAAATPTGATQNNAPGTGPSTVSNNQATVTAPTFTPAYTPTTTAGGNTAYIVENAWKPNEPLPAASATNTVPTPNGGTAAASSTNGLAANGYASIEDVGSGMALVASTMRAEQNTRAEQTGGRQPSVGDGWSGGGATHVAAPAGTGSATNFSGGIRPLAGSSTTNASSTANTTTNSATTRSFEATGENFDRPQTNLRTATAADIYNEVIDAEMPGERDPSQQETNTENVRQISFAGTGADFDPQVSRDGKSIIYASTQHRETADIYVQQVGSRVITRLTSDPGQDVMPAMSPNGEYVVFSSNRTGAWNLYMMPSTGGREVQLTNERTHDLHPSWSPDGRKLVFSRLGQTSGRWELWVMDITNPASLQFIGYGLFAEWSPVGGTGFQSADKIVFQRSRERGDRAFSIWTIDFNDRTLTAGQETEIVASTTEALINPSWSPDGDFVIYASVARAGDERGQRQPSSLWMIGHDGRGKVKLIGGASADLMPTWAPDNTVYFVSDRSGVENLWAFEVAQAVKTANAQRPGAGTPGAKTGPEFATVPTENQ